MTNDVKKWMPWNWFKDEQEEEKNKKPRFSRDNLPSFPEFRGLSRQQMEPFYKMQREFETLMDKMASQIQNVDFGFGDSQANENSLFKPQVDIKENKNEYIIEIDIPGVKKKDVSLEVLDNTLFIQGEKSHEKEDKNNKEGYHLIERTYGSFRRVLNLPNDADEESIDARFSDGVLQLTITKKELKKPEEKGRKIDIKKAA